MKIHLVVLCIFFNFYLGWTKQLSYNPIIWLLHKRPRVIENDTCNIVLSCYTKYKMFRTIKWPDKFWVCTFIDMVMSYHVLPTYQVSMAYVKRQTSYGPGNKQMHKKYVFFCPLHKISLSKAIKMVRDTRFYRDTSTLHQISKSYVKRQEGCVPEKPKTNWH